MEPEKITLLSSRELEKMRQAGRMAVDLLSYLEPMVLSGISTLEINDAADRWIQAKGVRSAMLGYNDYPKSICTSVNETVCNGIPVSTQILKDGDIITITVALLVDGYHGKTSRTFFVGEVSAAVRRLVEVTEECLRRGIAEVNPEARIGDIGAAIQEYAESQGFSVVQDFVGHGTGRIFHTAPQIPHYGIRGKGKKLRSGMVFTIQPMINQGTWEVEILADQWTAVTKDRKLSAQFEQVVAVTDSGVEILTPFNQASNQDEAIASNLVESVDTPQMVSRTTIAPEISQRDRQPFSLKEPIETPHQRGISLLGQGRYQQALDAFEAAIQLHPQSAEARLGKAVALHRLNRLQDALIVCEEALQIRPDLAEAYQLKAGTLFSLDNYQMALECSEKALQIRPDFAEAHHTKANILYAQGKMQEAIAACDQALQFNPDFLFAHDLKQQLTTQLLRAEVGRAMNFLNAYRFPEALEAFDTILQNHPDFAPGYEAKGIALGHLGKHEAALAAFERTIQLDPNCESAYFYKESALYHLGRSEEAVESFDALLNLRPTSIVAHFRKGFVLYQLGRFEQAIDAFNQALSFEPTLSEAHRFKGISLDQLGRYEEALEALGEAIRLHSHFPTLYHSRGIVLDKLGRYQEALSSFEKALRLDPKFAEAIHSKRIVLEKLSQLQ